MKRTKMFAIVMIAAMALAGGCDKKTGPTPAAASPTSTSATATATPTATPTEASPPASDLGAPATGGLSEAEMAPTIDKMVAFQDQLALAAEAAKGDCAAFAKALDVLAADNKALVAAVNAIKGNPANEDVARTLLGKVKPLLLESRRRLNVAGESCMDDDAVVAAFDKLGM